jgi:hypothetical protein
MNKGILIWWNKLSFISKFELMVKHKQYIAGYPYRNIDTLNDNEIKKLHELEHKHNGKEIRKY